MGRLGVARSPPTSLEAAFSARLGDDFLLNIPTRRKILRENTRLLHLTTAKSPVFGRTLINAFRELPDASDWEHPRRRGMGGNIQLAREFAEFSKEHPERAMRLLGALDPDDGTRAAAHALDAMSKETEPDLVLALLHDVVGRGFDDEEFRSSASSAVRQLAEREAEIDDRTIALLESWLAEPEPEGVADDAAGGEEHERAEARGEDEQDCTQRSLLWGHGGLSLVPRGSYPALEALIVIRRAREEFDQLDEMLESHLDRCKDPAIWQRVLRYLPSPHAGNHIREAAFIRRLFAEIPSLVGSRTGAQLLARSHSWNEDLADSELDRWRDSRSLAARQAYGEIVAIGYIVRPDSKWANERVDELVQDEALEEARAGAALTAAHYWPPTRHRPRAGDLLTRLLAFDDSEVWRAACEVFRLADTLAPDPATLSLLSTIERRPEKVPRAHSSLMVQCMGTLLPHEALLVARVAQGLIRVWREQLRDTSTSTALAAPELIDIALTLHRLAPETQEIGTDLFEQLIKIDAWEARKALDEIDSRFLEQTQRRRPRLARRSRRERRRRED